MSASNRNDSGESKRLSRNPLLLPKWITRRN